MISQSQVFATRFFLCSVLAFGGLSGPPAKADGNRSWIDSLIAECAAGDKKNTFASLAYSPAGYAWCKWSNRSIKQSRNAAVKACENYVPRKMRKIAPCKIIYEEGMIIDSDAIKHERSPTRVPVAIEIYDRSKDLRQNYSGFMVYGGIVTGDREKLSLINRGGEPICVGDYQTSNLSSVSRANCFGDIFIAKNVSNLRFFKRGKYYSKAYDMDFSLPDGSYIRARPRFK